jgi:hypothetical protein
MMVMAIPDPVAEVGNKEKTSVFSGLKPGQSK